MYATKLAFLSAIVSPFVTAIPQPPPHIGHVTIDVRIDSSGHFIPKNVIAPVGSTVRITGDGMWTVMYGDCSGTSLPVVNPVDWEVISADQTYFYVAESCSWMGINIPGTGSEATGIPPNGPPIGTGSKPIRDCGTCS